jgi:hypothetical protein
MATFEVRVWMPDRPGALGEVATRIGGVGGDVVGIEILERDGGSAIDELVVELPASVSTSQLTAAIGAAEGVAVEEVRLVVSALGDPRLEALDAVGVLLTATTEEDLLGSAVHLVGADSGAAWVAVVDLVSGVAEVATGIGVVPHTAWLGAYLEGSRSSLTPQRSDGGHGGVSWAPVPGSTLHLLLGRPARPLRGRERRRLTALARIVGLRRSELAFRRSVTTHPSRLAPVAG